MAHRKAGGTAKNLTRSNPQYLGIKISGGQKAQVGNVIVRQRGTKFLAGKNTKMAKDDSIFAMKEGVVEFKDKNKIRYDGRKVLRKVVSVK
jgi:large subunit ribosomal protein L27